jgi:60 kDa SS-A/Ro ribonucleoprotein
MATKKKTVKEVKEVKEKVILTKNDAGGKAYSRSAKESLAQLASTGCLNSTFYASAENQLDKIKELIDTVEPEFIAKLAIYSRKNNYMKDLPAFLCAYLAAKDTNLLKKVFKDVVDNGKMLGNFVQFIRTGVVGRKSLGTVPRNLVRNWINNTSDKYLFSQSVGNTPSLADIIKMVHPKPADEKKNQFYRYLIDGKGINYNMLPEIVQEFESFKKDTSNKVPEIPFQFLTSLELKPEQWAEIAKNSGFQMVRMNLNTFLRHGVFDIKGMTEIIAAKLSDANAIKKARVFPYQLLQAYNSIDEKVPGLIREALNTAMEISIDNVPDLPGKIFLFPDVSGSMKSPVTGYQKGATTTTRCVDVAGLFASAILRKNQDSEVIPFEQSIITHLKLNGKDSVIANAQKLASVGGGGTDCSAPLAELNRRGARGDLIVYISDNESWMDSNHYLSTGTQVEWKKFKTRNPNAKMVCIDLTPNTTTQAKESEDVLNIGGFSDHVFELISLFVKNELNADHWVGEIEKVQLNELNAQNAQKAQI